MANQVQETAVGYPVNWNWFFRHDRASSDVSGGPLNNDNNRNQRLNSNGNGNQSSGVTTRLLNNSYQSNNTTRRTNTIYYWLCLDPTWSLITLCIGAAGLIFLLIIFFVGLIAREVAKNPFLLQVEVTSLQVASMTISNNNNNSYMSADVNLTLGLMSMSRNEKLIIEPLLVSIEYDHEYLSSVKIYPFYIASQSYKNIQLDMDIRGSQLHDVALDSMAKALATNYALEFTLTIQGQYWILRYGFNYDYDVEITCDGLKVEFVPNSNLTTGTMINNPHSCKRRELY